MLITRRTPYISDGGEDWNRNLSKHLRAGEFVKKRGRGNLSDCKKIIIGMGEGSGKTTSYRETVNELVKCA